MVGDGGMRRECEAGGGESRQEYVCQSTCVSDKSSITGDKEERGASQERDSGICDP